MPLYEFECGNCGNTEDHFLSISKRNTTQRCSRCGKKLVRVPSKSVFGSVFFQETDDIDGKMRTFHSKKKFKQCCREHNVTPHI